jgi:hypothetical protein
MHRYLIGMSASLPMVRALLEDGGLVPIYLSHLQGFFTLPGRESIVDIRRQRSTVASQVWHQAVQYGMYIASLPFVRMVAVTGALTMDNVEPGDDIDFMIVTEPGRVWLCRAMIIGLVVKPAARRGIEICPNYLLSERALVMWERNLFTAHEIVQMVPVVGWSVYRRLCQLNAWASLFLPNAYGQPRRVDTGPLPHYRIRSLAETILRTPVGARLEQWEMRRKVDFLYHQDPAGSESTFTSELCKGHFGAHSQMIREDFAQRLSAIDEGVVANGA